MGPDTASMPEPHDAVAAGRALVAAHADDARAWVSLGHALWSAGARDEALAALEHALALDPDCADAHNNLGNAAMELDDHDRAIVHYRAARHTHPDHAEGHYNLGNALLAAGEAEEARRCFERAIALRPDHAGAYNNLGNVLRAQGRIAEAVACYRRAIALRPDHLGPRNNLALALIALDRPQEALAPLAEVLAQEPGHAEAANNLGGALLALDRLEEAESAFAMAIAAAPAQPQPRFGMALAQLGQGRFLSGWENYEARWRDPAFRDGKADPAALRWQGEALGGRRILLHAEQGLGDTIQFARYAPLVRARGGDVVLQVQPPLTALLAPLAATVLGECDALPPVDLHCPLMSLPYVFRTELTTIPAAVPYLRADPTRVAAFAARCAAGGRLRVGIAFSGRASHTDDALRSIAAAAFLPPLLATGAEMHVLQTEIRDADAAALAAWPWVTVHAHALHDFADTAALASLMDLVISVDTSVAHLAGALGRPTWVVLQRAADFRWMRERNDSPWYPSMRLFRQRDSGNWSPVLAEIATTLHTWRPRS